MFTRRLTKAVTRPGSIGRRRWSALLLATGALVLAMAGSAAAAPIPIPLNTTNWSGSAGFGSTSPGWYADSLGIIHLTGAAKQISVRPPLEIVLGTLPAAARPTRDVFTIVHTFNGTYADLEIETNGTIAVIGPPSPAVEDLSFVSLEGISYQPANKIPASAVTLNGANWSPHTGFGSDVGAPAAYRTGGVVRLEGAAKQISPIGGGANFVGTVPGNDRPGNGTVYTIAATNDGTYADVAINTSGQIFLIDPRRPALKDYLFVSLEGITYAAGDTLPSVAGIFTNTANWSPVGAFGSADPGWFEDTGGFIHLEGGLQQTSSSGPNALLVGILPIVARPTRTVYTIVHTFSGTYADLAITPGGQIFVIPPRPPAVTDLSFLSLEGITFDAPSPKHFALGVRGSENQGATVTATLLKPRALALLVQAVHGHRLATVGVVRLGTYPAGVSHIHWNLEVNGRVLNTGRYEVSLHALNGALQSVPASPGALTLVVLANGHVHVQN
jgi:hypothetical protein